MLFNLSKLSSIYLLLTFVVCETEGFPSPLTKTNFKERLSSGLHLVEFYSPYCSHCKSFAPTWTKTWEDFHEEGERLGIGMAQVDCVESGDLCNEEKILAYPSLKLYGPQGFIKSYPKTYKRNQEYLIKFMKEQTLKFTDPDLKVKSMSKMITTDEMVGYLQDSVKQPVLVSFWPSYELDDLNVVDAKKFFTYDDSDDDVISFQRIWKIVSNQVDKAIKVGHFNCLSNEKICSELGVDLQSPSVALILPHLETGKFITYDQTIYSLTSTEIVTFASRMVNIAQFKDVTTLDFAENYGILPHTNDLATFPDTAQTYFIYLYDGDTVSNEDFEILPYLIDTLSRLPNTHIFKSNDSSFLSLAEVQKRTIPKAVNAKLKAETVAEVDESRILFEMSTSLPTFLCFKENSMLPEVYHSGGPTDFRDQFKVTEWIKKNSIPYFDEFNLRKLRKFFAQPSGILALLLLENRDDTPENLRLIDRFMIENLKYNDILNNHIYTNVIKDRQEKVATFEQWKSQGKDTKVLLGQLAKEIMPAQYDDVQIGFLDIYDQRVLADVGISMDSGNYSNGDIIIFDHAKYYYDTDKEKGTTIKPNRLSTTLLMVQGIARNKNKAKLRDSPFSTNFRIMDQIHQYGLLGYLLICVALFVTYKRGKKVLNYMLTKRSLRNKGLTHQVTAGKLV